jgi:hypothetical protein
VAVAVTGQSSVAAFSTAAFANNAVVRSDILDPQLIRQSENDLLSGQQSLVVVADAPADCMRRLLRMARRPPR